jgi:8-oxo-dGTP pyrophosphatase MutT (NUDIX family)
MAREPIPTWYFAAVVVRHGDRFLLVQERKHDNAWYLPAGRVEPGESIADAAVRETLEESGVKVRLTGILRVEHTPRSRSARLRVVFLAEPRGDIATKRKPDRESMGAEWVSLSELPKYRLRGPLVEEVIKYVADGGRCFPLEVLEAEGASYPGPSGGTEHVGGAELGTLGKIRRSLHAVLIGRQPKP